MERRQWIIYGATGYTGRHIAEWAVTNGMRPALAGRDEVKVRALAERLGLDWDALELTDVKSAAATLARYSTVLHCAGPFIRTYKPMIEACIAARTHYLDINDEVDVCEGLAVHEAAAQKAGVMIMPAVGFDMVPGDCLALQLNDRLPDAADFDVAYRTEGTITRGSIRTAIGWRTTRIPNVTAFLYINPDFAKLAALSSDGDIDKLPEGPSDEELRTQSAFIVGEARNAAGESVSARLRTPQVYGITFPLAASIAQRVHDGDVVPGYQTPVRRFGKDFILKLDGCSIEWLH